MSPPLVITREQIEKAADIIISVFNRAEALSSFKAPHPVKYNLVDADKSEVASYLEYRASKKVKNSGVQNDDKFSNHPSKQIEEILNTQVQVDNSEPVTNTTLFVNLPHVDDNTSAYSTTPSEILSKNLGIPTVDSSEEKSEDNSATVNIIPH